jgi:hypothetical protein
MGNVDSFFGLDSSSDPDDSEFLSSAIFSIPDVKSVFGNLVPCPIPKGMSVKLLRGDLLFNVGVFKRLCTAF